MNWWKSGKILPLGEVQQKPTIQIPEGKYLIMHDPDSPDSKPKTYYHWIQSWDGTEILEYAPPTPPPRSGVHHYQFVLVKNKPIAPSQRSSQDIPIGKEIGYFAVNSGPLKRGGKRKTKKRKTKSKRRV